MQQKHNVPPPVLIPVLLENGTEGMPQYCCQHKDSVILQAWPFEQMMQDYLLDPFLFDNKYNLVNGDNPWGKYVSSNPANDKEVLASYCYSKTYDKYITDPDTQFLLCLEAYMDKTAKNAGLTSYAHEPFLLSVLHLKSLSGNIQVHGLCRRTYPTWSLVHQQRRSSTLTGTLPGACPIAITTR
jgi:hypothetical protein